VVQSEHRIYRYGGPVYSPQQHVWQRQVRQWQVRGWGVMVMVMVGDSDGTTCSAAGSFLLWIMHALSTSGGLFNTVRFVT
jgi:hypothetical protein